MKKKITSLLLVLSMVFSMSTMQVSATTDQEIVAVGNQVATYSTDTSSMLKTERAVEWIDRLDLTNHTYAKDLYTWLEDNATATGNLVTVAEDYYTIRTITGESEFTFESGASNEAIQQAYDDKFNEIYNSIYTTEYAETRKYVTAVYEAFDRDHPEVFWLSGKSMIGISAGSSIPKTDGNQGTFSYEVKFVFYLKNTAENFDIRAAKYTGTANPADAIAMDISIRDSKVTTVKKLVEGLTRYEKIKQINKWLTENNCYNSAVVDDINATVNMEAHKCISALGSMTGLSAPVCEGYARAFKVLCDNLGIPCVLVSGNGTSSNGTEAHMWNYVQMDDGKWYAVDVTWNDPTVNGITSLVSGSENEMYLLVGSTTEIAGMTFEDSHEVENIVGEDKNNSAAFINEPELSTTEYKPTKLIGYSLSLSGNIGLNFYMQLDSEVLKEEGADMLITLPNGIVLESSIKDSVNKGVVTEKGVECYVFTAEVAAKEMTKDVKIQLVRADGSKGAEYQYSVKDYADYILNSSDSQYVSAIPLVKSMLNYGAEAQNYFGYNTSDLANVGVAGTENGVISAETLEKLNLYEATGTLPADIKYYGTSLILESETKIRHYFTKSSKESIALKVKLGTEELTAVETDTYFYVDIKNIAAADLDHEYTVDVYEGDEKVYSIKYSALTYAYNILSSNNVDVKLSNLVNNLYWYNYEANLYKENTSTSEE